MSGTTTLCNGESTTLTVSGADAYSWKPLKGLNTTSGPVVSASPADDIIYTITGNNFNGCSAVATASLKVNLLPAVTIMGDACSDTITATVVNAAAGVDWKLNGNPYNLLMHPGMLMELTLKPMFIIQDPYLLTVTTTYVSMGFEADNNIVLKFSPGNPEPDTVAGSSNYGNGDNQLELPNDVWVDAQGNVYVADRNNGRVQKWAPGATRGLQGSWEFTVLVLPWMALEIFT